MKEHDLYTPKGYEGISACRTCGGAEGSLPTDCPGGLMLASTEEAIYNGIIDFVGGKWVLTMKEWENPATKKRIANNDPMDWSRAERESS